ncbi:MAG: phosphoglycerate kinase [Pseudomonadales bacterium]
MQLPTLADFELNGKTVLVRQDLNVPIQNGQISSDARIRAALPTLRQILAKGGRLRIMSHLGRPEEGIPVQNQPEVSLAPVAAALEAALGEKVTLVDDYLSGVFGGGDAIVLFENVRVNAGEKKNDKTLARQLAALCDIFVMDAFGTAHRAQASTAGIVQFAPVVCVGPLVEAELKALAQALESPQPPVVAIVGGSKVSSKLSVLESLSDQVDTLIVGGGIANTFLAAAGIDVGASLYEPDLVGAAQRIAKKVQIPDVIDVVVSQQFAPDAPAQTKRIGDVGSQDMILDLGPETMKGIKPRIAHAKTIIWNGPVGVFEYPQFAAGTRVLTQAIASSQGYSLAGGGDTLAAIETFGVEDQIGYISTGGGAFLEFIEGKPLPAIAAIKARVAADPHFRNPV